MKQIIVFPLEPIDTRYTGQWWDHIQSKLQDVELVHLGDLEVLTDKATTTGAFLNFAATNVWKSHQLQLFATKVQQGLIRKGAKILFMDAWNPAILQVRYMSDLLGLELDIHAVWHAGSYDEHDFLGRIKDKRWSKASEQAFAYASNINYFATDFHLELFKKKVFSGAPMSEEESEFRFVRTGFPFEYFEQMFAPYRAVKKERQIVFPHRLAPEKQVEIFRDLAVHMPDVKFVIAQESKLTKNEYHDMISKSMISFSANLQETYGIGQLEALYCDTFPLSPSRLSYTEMYDKDFLYPSYWTLNFKEYTKYRDQLIHKIREVVENFDIIRQEGYYERARKHLGRYTHADVLWNRLKE